MSPEIKGNQIVIKHLKVLASVALGAWVLALVFANSQLPERSLSRIDQTDRDYDHLKEQLVELQRNHAPMKDRAAVHRAIGMCMLSRKQGEIAAMEFLKYKRLTQETQGVSNDEIARCLNIVGSYYLGMKDFDTSQRYYQQALALDQAAKSQGVARDLNNLANLYYLWGQSCAAEDQAKHELCFKLAQDFFNQARAANPQGDDADLVAANSRSVADEIAHDQPIY